MSEPNEFRMEIKTKDGTRFSGKVTVDNATQIKKDITQAAINSQPLLKINLGDGKEVEESLIIRIPDITSVFFAAIN